MPSMYTLILAAEIYELREKTTFLERLQQCAAAPDPETSKKCVVPTRLHNKYREQVEAVLPGHRTHDCGKRTRILPVKS